MHTFESRLYDIDKYNKLNKTFEMRYMHRHVNELFNVYSIILNRVENNDLCWIACGDLIELTRKYLDLSQAYQVSTVSST